MLACYKPAVMTESSCDKGGHYHLPDELGHMWQHSRGFGSHNMRFKEDNPVSAHNDERL